MIKRRMVDILLVLVSLAIIAVIWMIQTPSEAQGEDVPETEIETDTDTYEVEVTEEDKVVVGDATESDTEPTEMPPESTEAGTEEVSDTSEENIEEETEEPPEATYYCEWGDFYLTQEEYELLLTTVYCESQTATREGRYMVALTILNQYNSGRFGSTLHKVIYKRNNFSVTNFPDFEEWGWSDKVEEAVTRALKENNHPRDMFYFRTGHYHSWAEDYMKVGKIYFSTDK